LAQDAVVCPWWHMSVTGCAVSPVRPRKDPSSICRKITVVNWQHCEVCYDASKNVDGSGDAQPKDTRRVIVDNGHCVKDWCQHHHCSDCTKVCHSTDAHALKDTRISLDLWPRTRWRPKAFVERVHAVLAYLTHQLLKHNNKLQYKINIYVRKNKFN